MAEVLVRIAVLASLVTVLVACGGGSQATPSPPRTGFDSVANLGAAINSQSFDGGPSLSADGLTLYFVTDRDIDTGGDIWIATRRTSTEAFVHARSLRAPVNSAADEGAPSISADGLELFFDRSPDGRIFVARRANASAPFGEPVVVDLACSNCHDGFPGVSGDGLRLFFCSDRAGGSGGDDLWVAARASTALPFHAPSNLGPGVNGSANDCEPNVSRDGTKLYFASDRKGGSGGYDMWVSSRASTTEQFSTALNLGLQVHRAS